MFSKKTELVVIEVNKHQKEHSNLLSRKADVADITDDLKAEA